MIQYFIRSGIFILICACTVLFIFGSISYADMKITSKTEMSVYGLPMGNSTSSDYYRMRMVRFDYKSNINPLLSPKDDGPPDAYNITRYDKGIQWIVFDFDSSYGEIPLRNLENPTDTILSDSTDDLKNCQKSIVWSYELAPLYDSLIGIYYCRGLKITATEPKAQSKITITLWVAQNVDWFQEFLNYEANKELKNDLNPFRTAPLILSLAQSFGLDAEKIYSLASYLRGVTISASLEMLVDIDAISDKSDSIEDKLDNQQIAVKAQETTNEHMLDLPEKPDTANIEALDELKQSILANKDIGHNALMKFTTTIIEVDQAPLPDSLFEIPAGYEISK